MQKHLVVISAGSLKDDDAYRRLAKPGVFKKDEWLRRDLSSILLQHYFNLCSTSSCQIKEDSPDVENSLSNHHRPRSRMTQSRYGGGRGRTNGDGRGGAGRAGRGQGYPTKPKSTKVGLCKELEHHVFDYGGHGAADTMRVTQEKIQQYVGIKYGEDIANELKNRFQVVINQPEYSLAIKARHVKYDALVRAKQTNLLNAMQAQLATLQQQVAAGVGNTDLVLSTAKMQNEITDLQFEVSSEEAAVHYNLGKSYSVRQDKPVTVRGQVFALIYGQCTQLLQDKMKQEKNWIAVSASYKPLDLYKLIESVVLKQTEDQYPVAAVWEQYCQVYNAKQGSNSNTEWYKDSIPR
jgi:hypothetical protein